MDLSVNTLVPTIQSGWATTIAIGISYAFDTYSLLVVSLAIASYLFYKNYRLQSLLLLGAMGGDALLVVGFKTLVQSPRPTNMVIFDMGYSFPSGHTVGGIVFCGLLAYFAWQHWQTTRPQAVVIALATLIASVVGFDRIYLNVHWFSDVLGGCLLGIFWLTVSILIFTLLTIDGKPPSERFNKISSILFCVGVIVAVSLLILQLFPLHLGSFPGFVNFVVITCKGWMAVYGPIGLFTAMIISSVLSPIPNEVFLAFAGMTMNPLSVAFFGALGSTVGAVICFYIARLGGQPLVKRFVKESTLAPMNQWFNKWGSWAILLGRLIPLVPFDAVSYLSGLTKTKVTKFSVLTFIGAIPRCLLYAYIGELIAAYNLPFLILLVIIVVIILLIWEYRKSVLA
ncbi:MAG: VTT domain-containing protein [Candidatus Bathyarchaeota archaeon]|nr:VTT domain-containing protein [Candidatus Bathyarchaeota archaeon]